MKDVQQYYRITYSFLSFYLFHVSYTNFPPFLQSLKNIFKINPKSSDVLPRLNNS